MRNDEVKTALNSSFIIPHSSFLLKPVVNVAARARVLFDADVLEAERNVRVEVEAVAESRRKLDRAGRGDHRGVVGREVARGEVCGHAELPPQLARSLAQGLVAGDAARDDERPRAVLAGEPFGRADERADDHALKARGQVLDRLRGLLALG